jgi:hypothetical protein
VGSDYDGRALPSRAENLSRSQFHLDGNPPPVARVGVQADNARSDCLPGLSLR